MKMSVLDMTQEILSRLDSEEVNAIGDNPESRQVANLLKSAYFNIIARANLPEHWQLISLTASGSADYPVIMYRPENIASIEWIKYNVQEDETLEPLYGYVTILPNQQFLDMIHQLNPAEDNVDSFVLDGMTFYFKTDRHPCYCTVLKDSQFIFDSYNSAIEATLQESKVLASGRKIPEFRMEDTFIPDLDDQQFRLLVNEATSLAFVDLKQMPNQKAEQEVRRQWSSLQKNKQLNKLSAFDQLPNFARKR